MVSFYFIVDKNEVVEYNSGERNNREGEIVCKEYKNFNELPLELQEKFKSRVRGNILAMSKHGLCVYDSKEEMVISATKNGKLNKGKPKNKHKKGVDMDE